ncbi:U11/U12 small nuclear ribonucleoprotein 25 kDa protein-like protein [Drosera capensis]
MHPKQRLLTKRRLSSFETKQSYQACEGSQSEYFTVHQHPQNPFPRPHCTDSPIVAFTATVSSPLRLRLRRHRRVLSRLFDFFLSSTRCTLESLCFALCILVVVWIVGVMMIELAEETTPFLRNRGSFQRIRTRRVIGLSVLKLDGSRFDVQVAKNAKVSDLRIAVEEVFSLSAQEDGSEVSWSHVWGHFCLCFDDRKLTNDKALIRQYGITDGDQLHFVRHMTIDYKPRKSHSKEVYTSARSPFMSLPRHTARKTTNKQARADENLTSADNLSHIDDDKEDEQSQFPEFRLRHFFRRWLSYSIGRGTTSK